LNQKKNIINEINSFYKLNDKEKMKSSIENELTKKSTMFKYDKKYYRDLIFFSKSENVLDEIDLELVFCVGNPELTDIWKYFKVMSSSAITGDNGFGSLKIMLKDKVTQQYLGILELSNDILSCEPRDFFIGWDKNIKNEKININNDLSKARSAFIINISCCIGLQPMAYNLNIGKLLVKTVFCKEVLDYFYNIRGYYYAGVTTFGLYGKSIQYDRLKEIKYIGETKGNGTCDFPIDLYEKVIYFVKKYYPEEYCKRSLMSSSKMRLLQFGLNQLDYNYKEMLNHGKLRGIYFGYTSSFSKDFLNGNKNTFEINNNIKSFKETFKEWKERWAIQRLQHLLKNNRFKIAFELKDFTSDEKKIEYAKQYQYEKFSDEIYMKYKKNKSKEYYYNNKEKILEKVNISLDNFNKNDQFLYPEYLAGFFDSDGSIYFDKTTLKINFSQCIINVLLLIQKEYGGIIYKNNKRSDVKRIEYSLIISGEYAEKIINVLSQKSVLKIDKINIGKEYLKYINKESCDEKIELVKKFRELKKQDDKIYFNRINWKYIAGMFDGDGCITINYSDLENNRLNPKFSICQKYTPNFLEYIKNFMINDINEVKISCNKLNIYVANKEVIMKIYDKIKNYIHIKKYQFECLIMMINEYKKSTINLNLIKSLGEEMRKNKHDDVNYDLNILENNIVTSITNNIVNKIDEIQDKEMINKTHTKILQSEKKMGINNPNYGKEMSEDHKSKISMTNSIIKRGDKYTDTILKEIFQLKGIIPQKNVAEKYGCNREIIRRIWSEEMVPTDHSNYGKSKVKDVSEKDNKSSSQKTSEGKRTLDNNVYIEIILWKKKKTDGEKLNDKIISSTKLSEHLSQKYNQKVTNDIVKNIWCGKTKMYETDFMTSDLLSYFDYCEIIKN
jgi:hypothetical protein